jgi:hypothetical protein
MLTALLPKVPRRRSAARSCPGHRATLAEGRPLGGQPVTAQCPLVLALPRDAVFAGHVLRGLPSVIGGCSSCIAIPRTRAGGSLWRRDLDRQRGRRDRHLGQVPVVFSAERGGPRVTWDRLAMEC